MSIGKEIFFVIQPDKVIERKRFFVKILRTSSEYRFLFLDRKGRCKRTSRKSNTWCWIWEKYVRFPQKMFDICLPRQVCKMQDGFGIPLGILLRLQVPDSPKLVYRAARALKHHEAFVTWATSSGGNKWERRMRAMIFAEDSRFKPIEHLIEIQPLCELAELECSNALKNTLNDVSLKHILEDAKLRESVCGRVAKAASAAMLDKCGLRCESASVEILGLQFDEVEWSFDVVNQESFDLLSLVGLVGYASENGLFLSVWNSKFKINTADSVMSKITDISNYSAVASDRSFNLLLRGIDAESHLSQIKRRVESENAQVKFHDDNGDAHNQKRKVLIIVSYASSQYKRRERILSKSPELTEFDVKFLYLSKYSDRLDCEFDHERSPLRYLHEMKSRMQTQIEDYKPHVLLIHHGDFFHFCNGILTTAVKELNIRYPDVKFAFDLWDIHNRSKLSVDDELRSLVKIVFQSSDWGEYGQ